MPALPADIARATRQARIVTRTDAAVQSAFPDARDGAGEPSAGYFENASDALAALEGKAQLIGAFRRRYVSSIGDEIWIDPMAGIPTVRVVDPSLGADALAIITRVEVDMETETSRIEGLG